MAPWQFYLIIKNIYIYIFGKDMTGPHVEDDEDVKIDIVIRWTNATSNP